MSDERIASDLIQRVTTLESKPPVDIPIAPEQKTSPFWSCEMLLSATVSGLGATDWDATFDDPMNSRVAFELSSASGLFFSMIGNSVNKPVRARWAFQNDGAPFSTPGVLYADSFGRIQIKVNGSLSQYTAATDITFNFGSGFNLLQISLSDALDKAELYIQMIDRITANWVDPNVNRVRRLAGGSSAGSGGVAPGTGTSPAP